MKFSVKFERSQNIFCYRVFFSSFFLAKVVLEDIENIEIIEVEVKKDCEHQVVGYH